jgi:hypothetical protein
VRRNGVSPNITTMNRLKQYSVECMYESTTRQRAYRRAFDRERQREDKADRRPWEDDD